MTEYPNWFEQTARENFELYLAEFADKPNLTFLQIGAFTGDASVWMLDNVLTGLNSSLYDVDTWKGSDEEVHAEMDFVDVYKTYLSKTEGRLNVYRNCTESADYFSDNGLKEDFDFIYIDGDHTASGVLDDAVLGFRALKSGGIMAFDDYTWGSPKGLLYAPRMAIDTFLTIKQGQYELLAVNTQVWIRKL